ncbi:hypothetical protein [Mesorhizobium sp.]|uniref:hypothetical protein n=1 Tax=Mesorhizobium sp. TaxID=1871066 RepID=UPI00257FDD7F|nr:hypothetical protein [Mesorhizobium sp.]
MGTSRNSSCRAKKWVKNERLGFFIPYRRNGLPAGYIPDFIVVADRDENVIVGIKGPTPRRRLLSDGRGDQPARAIRDLALPHCHRPGRIDIMLNPFTSAWRFSI